MDTKIRIRKCKDCKKEIEWIRCRVRCRECYIKYCKIFVNDSDVQCVKGMWEGFICY